MEFESVAVIGAFCTLIGVLLRWENSRNKSLISFVKDTMKQNEEYHVQKNNHMERMDMRHLEDSKETRSVILKLTDKVDLITTTNINNISVLDDCARALGDYNKKQ